MQFGTLRSEGLASFLERHALRDELCAFIHIPKTAGSSFGTELRRMRRPSKNIHVQFVEGQQTSTIEAAIREATDSEQVARLRSCSGHFTWNDAAALRDARPDTRFVSFLRDPVQRVISDYRYSRTPAHPPHRQIIERFPDIASYVADPVTANKMSRFLLPSLDMSGTEIERHLDDQFLFVGVLEMYPMGFNIVTRLLGGNALPVEHKRRTEETTDNVVEASRELVDMIEDRNRTDRLLYGIVRQRLRARKAEWQALKRASRPSRAGEGEPAR